MEKLSVWAMENGINSDLWKAKVVSDLGDTLSCVLSHKQKAEDQNRSLTEQLFVYTEKQSRDQQQMVAESHLTQCVTAAERPSVGGAKDGALPQAQPMLSPVSCVKTNTQFDADPYTNHQPSSMMMLSVPGLKRHLGSQKESEVTGKRSVIANSFRTAPQVVFQGVMYVKRDINPTSRSQSID